MPKTIGATEFKASCLRIINEMNRDRVPVIVTKRGKPVAVLSPIEEPAKPRSILGAMRGSVLRYDDPFSPAADPDDWDAVRDTE